MRPRSKLPIGAAILLQLRNATLGIAAAASIVMVGCVFAKFLGYPIKDARTLGDNALRIFFVAMAVYAGLVAFAWYVDRKRGL